MAQSIAGEQPGDYYNRRRFYRRNYFFWGYVRRPQQPWSKCAVGDAKRTKILAPDREATPWVTTIIANNAWMVIFGQTVYEPLRTRSIRSLSSLPTR